VKLEQTIADGSDSCIFTYERPVYGAKKPESSGDDKSREKQKSSTLGDDETLS